MTETGVLLKAKFIRLCLDFEPETPKKLNQALRKTIITISRRENTHVLTRYITKHLYVNVQPIRYSCFNTIDKQTQDINEKVFGVFW